MSRSVEQIGAELGRALRAEREARELRERLERELEQAAHDQPLPRQRPAWATEVTGLEHTLPPGPGESRLRRTGWLRNRREQRVAELGGETTALRPEGGPLTELSQEVPCPGEPYCLRGEHWHRHFADGKIYLAQ